MIRRAYTEYDPFPELDIVDQHKLDTAEGLHMLGQYVDSATEIARISPAGWNHPLVLHLASRAYSALHRIPEALDCVERFIQAAPYHPFGYVFKGQMLEYSGKPKESYDLLCQVISHFPAHGTMHYELARVAAKCALWDEARHWIYRAICIQHSLKIGALNTDALRPIRAEIEAMHPGN